MWTTAGWVTRALLLVVVLAGLHAGPAGADRDLSNVNDILAGRRNVLRADDLVFGASGTDLLRAGAVTTKQLQMTQSAIAYCGAYPDPFLVRVGRVFPLKNDVIIRLAPLDTGGGQCSPDDLGLYIEDTQNPTNSSVARLAGLRKDPFVQIVLGDFTDDGLDDILLFTSEGITLYTAAKPDAPAQGLVEAARLVRGSTFLTPLSEPVVGDFNGDGFLDVAWAGWAADDTKPWTVFFASVCPPSSTTTTVLSQSCPPGAARIILATPTIDLGVDQGFQTNSVVLAAGDYDGIPSETTGVPAHELAVVRQTVMNRSELHHELTVYSFDKNLNPTAAKPTFALPKAVLPSGPFQAPQQPVVASGRLQAGVQTDQVVVAHGMPDEWIAVIAFDRDLNMTVRQTNIPYSPTFTTPGYLSPGGCLDYVGLAVGRYDPPNITVGQSTIPDLSLQVGLFMRQTDRQSGSCGTSQDHNLPSAGHLAIFTIDFTDFSLTLKSFSGYLINYVPNGPNGLLLDIFNSTSSNLLWAGDTQGRSLKLGKPTKVAVESFRQPSVILAAPPMHVDYIVPVGTSRTQRKVSPVVLNLTGVPSTYFTQYQADQSIKTQASDQHASSWAHGVKVEASAKVMFGSPKTSNFSIEAQYAHQQMKEDATKTIDQSYTQQRYEISSSTGGDDQIFYTESRINLYIYPVLGHTECVDDGTECTEDKKRPLFVQYSVPDQITTDTLEGSALEWYQPPWQPGNVFSYPRTEDQLKALYQGQPDISILGQTLLWATDNSGLEITASWASGTSQSQSTSSKQTYSNEGSVTVAGQYVVPGIASIGGSFTVGGSSTNATAALNSHQSSIGTSTGISVVKPKTFADPPSYQYAVTSYIYGQQPPQGNVDTTQPALPTDNKTFGILRTAYTADPTHAGSGGWWSQAYGKRPDVGLNHPLRWDFSTAARNASQGPECLGVTDESSTVQCAKLREILPLDPWTSSVHHLRGFFISLDGTDGGPQLETATAGDVLVLKTRVYNFSLKEMPDNTVVHVRFYGQPWHPALNHAPCEDCSFLIGEDRLGPIPPFGKGDFNWALAQTKFDTSKYPGYPGEAEKDKTKTQYLVFWVFVWIQEPNDGPLANELPGHGLKAVPGELHSMKDAIALLEGYSDSNPVSYSNNFGMYKFAFAILPKGSPSTLLSATSQSRSLQLGPVQVSSNVVSPRASIEVSTMLDAPGEAVPGVTVRFYDGDPRQGGKLFDVERVAHMSAGESHLVRVLFQPQTCGDRRIFVVVDKGTPSEQVGQSDVITGGCSTR